MPTMRRPLPAAKLRSSRPEPQPRSSTVGPLAARLLAIEDEVLVPPRRAPGHRAPPAGPRRSAGRRICPRSRRVEAPDGQPLDGGDQQQHEDRHRHRQRPAQSQAGQAGYRAANQQPAASGAPQAPRYSIRPRITNSARSANGTTSSPTASAASPITRTRLLPAPGHGRSGVSVGTGDAGEGEHEAGHQHGEQRQGGDGQPGAAAHRWTTRAGGRVIGRRPDRCRGTGRSHTAWAMEWPRSRRRGSRRSPSRPAGRLLQPLWRGRTAADHAGIQEVQGQLIGQAAVLRLVGERVDRQLQRVPRAARGGGRGIAHVARLVVGDHVRPSASTSTRS